MCRGGTQAQTRVITRGSKLSKNGEAMNMKKYLGSFMDAYIACIFPILFFALPIVFAFIALSAEISPATVFIACFCLLCIVMGVISLRRISLQVYSWGKFDEKGIHVKNGWRRFEIEYEKCRSIGIGFYAHGFQSRTIGIKNYYIFFSYEWFEEKYRANINLWKPSDTRIKVGFSKKLYRYLLTVLPKNHAAALKRDYEMIQRQTAESKKHTPKTKKRKRSK